MSIVLHKYRPEQMPENELMATFAAREHVLDFLLNALRQQTQSGTLSSYLITGPRGVGKSALLRMLRIRIQNDSYLAKAWRVVSFPEEQFNVATVRDLLAETLGLIGEQGVAAATDWLVKVQAEPNDEQSEALAGAALREIARREGRRIILFVENLNDFFDCLTDTMKRTLRCLLMTDPFMLIIGSAVHMFESLQKYDEAFFNYFCHVPLPRLQDDEVHELLRKRGEYDQNEPFLRKLPRLRAKIRTMTHLSGGNPRLILMLYELLSEKQVTTVVQELRRLIDELTPLLKHELENLSPQQQKIVHALMEKGGTATPAEIALLTRLSLNTVTAQLRRLKESQILELRGGGKGQAAYYTAPDQLFSIWYRMHCLGQHRRQIELFVEVLRVWFEAEERFQFLTTLATVNGDAPSQSVRETAATTEYYAASLTGTPHEEKARDLALRQWLKADLREAALAHAEFARIQATDERAYETKAYASLGEWFVNHKDPRAALPALAEAASQSGSPGDLLVYGMALGLAGDYAEATRVFDEVVAQRPDDPKLLSSALIDRALVKDLQSDSAGAINDYTAVVELTGISATHVVKALFWRGMAKSQQGDATGAISDWMRMLDTTEAPVETRCVAGAKAFRTCWSHQWIDLSERLLARLCESINNQDTLPRYELLLLWLATLAAPDFKKGWVAAYRYFLQHQSTELAGALALFNPVCEVLETGDRSILDRLPPEHRELAVQVLASFEPASKTSVTAK